MPTVILKGADNKVIKLTAGGVAGPRGFQGETGDTGAVGPSGADVFVGPTQPLSMQERDLWFDTDDNNGQAVLDDTYPLLLTFGVPLL